MKPECSAIKEIPFTSNLLLLFLLLNKKKTLSGHLSVLIRLILARASRYKEVTTHSELQNWSLTIGYCLVSFPGYYFSRVLTPM